MEAVVLFAFDFGSCYIIHGKHSPRREQIYGGRYATIEEAPYHVIVAQAKRTCGGTLITMQHVLTAAHCINTKEKYPIFVHAGTAEIEDAPKTFGRVKSYKIHENYNSYNLDSDIAVITLEKPFKKSSKLQPAKLPKNEVKVDDIVTITGFGTEETKKNIKDRYMKIFSGSVITCPILNNAHDICIRPAEGDGSCVVSLENVYAFGYKVKYIVNTFI